MVISEKYEVFVLQVQVMRVRYSAIHKGRPLAMSSATSWLMHVGVPGN